MSRDYLPADKPLNEQLPLTMPKPSAVAVIDNFFGYEGIRTRATATDMSDGERLVMWLRVNGLKIVPMTHLDCTDD